MKHRILLLLTIALLLGSCAARRGGTVSTARITDDNFRNYLLQNGYVEPLKGDKVRATSVGRQVMLMDCHHMNIASLDGIELFPELQILICSENPLQHIDLSRNTKLVQLMAIETPLKSLDVSRSKNLKVLQVSFNQLRRLDVSHNPNLEELLCIFAPRITSIDVSHNPNLATLYIRETNIRQVDLRRNRSFKTLHALDTPLENIVLSPQHDLDDMRASVEDWVQLVVLDTLALLPKLSRKIPEHEADTTNSRHPIVMNKQQADSAGYEIKALRQQYPPAFSYDTVAKKFDRESLVQTEENMGQFELSWMLFLQGLGSEFKSNGVVYDSCFRIWGVACFTPDGYVDYYLYQIKEGNPFSDEMEARFNKALTEYFANTAIGFGAKRKFSQCGSINFLPSEKEKPKVSTEELAD